MWSDRIKIFHLPDGKIRFASTQTTTSSSQRMNLNAWNFVRIVQVGTDARISVNGVSQGPYANVDPIPFIGNDVLQLGADVAGAGGSNKNALDILVFLITSLFYILLIPSSELL